MPPVTIRHTVRPEVDTLTARLDSSRRLLVALGPDADPDVPPCWDSPWSAMLLAERARARLERALAKLPQLGAAERARARAALAAADRLSADLAATPLTAALVLDHPHPTGRDQLSGPVRRRLLGLSASDRDRPLADLADPRPARWVGLSLADLGAYANAGAVSSLYWAALTVTPHARVEHELGDTVLLRVPAGVADLAGALAAQNDRVASLTPARKADTPAQMALALRLWDTHRYQRGPLATLAGARTAARGITAPAG